MLMTVNIKVSIIAIAEITPSTYDTCLLQRISPENGPSKVNCTWTGGIPNSPPANMNPLFQYNRLFQLFLRPYAEQYARASIGGGRGGGDASPHFSGWGDSIGIVPPVFSSEKRHIA